MDLKNWKWINATDAKMEGEELVLYAPAETNYFNDPEPINGLAGIPQGLAPVLYTNVEGDFVMRAKVTPSLDTQYDAAGLMVIQDDTMWAKAVYEKTDFGTNAIVCVVTDRISDDANGCNIDQDSIWLQMARIDNTFVVHYSLDGETYYLVRIFTLPVDKEVKVGLVAQCPEGKGNYHRFGEVSIESKTLSNIRAGGM